MRHIKPPVCSVERYLTLNLKRNERSVLAPFICGILPLKIETGRFIGEKVDKRLSRICNSSEIENETHFFFFFFFFLFKCTHYNDLRNTLSTAIENRGMFNYSLKILMDKYPRQTAKYLVNAFMKRKQFLYVFR